MGNEADWSTMFDALRSVYRRRVLAELLARDSPDDEVQVPEDIHVGDRELDALQVALVHVHLPKLESAGFVRWNPKTHRVARGPKFDQIAPLLRVLDERCEELPDGLV